MIWEVHDNYILVFILIVEHFNYKAYSKLYKHIQPNIMILECL